MASTNQNTQASILQYIGYVCESSDFVIKVCHKIAQFTETTCISNSNPFPFHQRLLLFSEIYWMF
jgi:hypothetical protein